VSLTFRGKPVPPDALDGYRTATLEAAAAIQSRYEAVNPTACYHVPRYRWPAAWAALTDRNAPFTTGRPVRPEPGRAAPIEVNVRESGAAILESLGGRLVAGADRVEPWAAKLRAGAMAHLRDAGPDDPLEAAFRREAARLKAARDGQVTK
jgi:hypothetical protein